VISDAHEGLKAAIAKVLHATWQPVAARQLERCLDEAKLR
jgi:hypothetical protein